MVLGVTTGDPKVRIAVVECQEIYRRGLVATLAEAGLMVVAAGASLDVPLRPPPDVVVIGADTDVEAIASAGRTATVLVLTSHTSMAPANLRLAGDLTFLSRDATAEALLAAVHAAVSGTEPPSPVVSRPPDDVEALDDAERGVLSMREYQVLRQIADGRTQTQIARALGISYHTVDSYIRRIRSKLGLGNKAELTRAAMLGELGPGSDDGRSTREPGHGRAVA